MGKKDKMRINTNLGAGKEFLDFSGKTWSYKGEVPEYPVQPDGFTYDIDDADGNDKNAVCLGLIGMIIIVLNSKSAKIKAEELLPPFNQVIGMRGWYMVSEKDANFLAKTAIKKLTSAETSGDVFDLASYAPLEIKRNLLKKLFSIARYKIKPEYLDEAESRIVEDIVPNIFESPDLELALLTGLVVKADTGSKKKESSASTDFVSIAEPDTESTQTYRETVLSSQPSDVHNVTAAPQPNVSPDETISAFDELRRLYSDPTPESIVERRRAEAAQTVVPQETFVPTVTRPVESVSSVEPVSPVSVQQPVSVMPASQPVFVSQSVESAPLPQKEAVSQVKELVPEIVQQAAPQPVVQTAPVSTGMPLAPTSQQISSDQPVQPISVNVPQLQQTPSPVSVEIPQPAVPVFAQSQSQRPSVSVDIPQPAAPNFSNPAYGAPSFEIPQPSAPNFGGAPMNARPQNPLYGASQQPQQQNQNPFYQQNGNPYGYAQQGMPQQGYYAQQPQPQGQSPFYQQNQQNPYAYPPQGQPQQNPFYMQNGNPYGYGQQNPQAPQNRPMDPNAQKNQNRGA